LSGLTYQQYATTPEECIDFLEKAIQGRTSARTNTNAHSSRSHMMMNITVTSSFPNGGGQNGTLLLVDLAGSESRSKVVRMENY
jgi:hypothetical protein